MDYRTERGYREIDQPYLLQRFYQREAMRERNRQKSTRLVLTGLVAVAIVLLVVIIARNA